MLLRTHIVVLHIGVLLLLTGCAAWAGPPPIATAQIDPPSAHQPRLWPTTTTPVPTSAELVWLDDLAAHPEAYENTFVEIYGLVDFGLPILNCSAGRRWMGAPVEWRIVNLPAKENSLFGVTGYQKDILAELRHDPVAVWGWVRAYRGPDGCVDPTASAPHQGVQWYLDPVQIQSLERE
jgi:hypothetical protein